MGDKRRWVIVWGGIAGFLFLAFLAVVGDRGFLQVREFNRHLGRVELQIRTQQQENVRLGAEALALKNDPYQIEKLAREELGLARPDELIFEILDSGASQP
jgi:cell division protein FtsB